MEQLRLPTPRALRVPRLAARGEHLLEVQALARIDRVHHLVRPELAHPPTDRRHVRRRVEVSPVGLAHQHGLTDPVVVEPDDQRPLRLLGDAPRLEIGDDLRQVLPVCRFPRRRRVRDVDVQAPAVLEAVLQRDLADPLPDRQIRLVPRLQRDQRLFRSRQRLLRAGDLLLQLRARLRAEPELLDRREPPPIRRRVELRPLVDVLERVGRQRVEVDLSALHPVLDRLCHHRDRQTPVPKVVLAFDVVPEALVQARERVADHRRPDVPHVHLLREIDAAEIDDDGLLRLRHLPPGPGLPGRHDPEPRPVQRLQRRVQRLGPQPDVDESRTRDLRRLGDVRDVQRRDDRLGHLARVLPRPLGQRHRGVRLEVPVQGIPGRRQQRVGALGQVRTERRGHRGQQTLTQNGGGVGHGRERRAWSAERKRAGAADLGDSARSRSFTGPTRQSPRATPPRGTPRRPR